MFPTVSQTKCVLCIASLGRKERANCEKTKQGSVSLTVIAWSGASLVRDGRPTHKCTYFLTPLQLKDYSTNCTLYWPYESVSENLHFLL